MDPKLERIVIKAKLEREHNCPIWETKEGEFIPVTQMTHDHLTKAHRVMCEAAWNARSEHYFFRVFKKASKLDEEMHRRPYPYDHTFFDRLLTIDVLELISENHSGLDSSGWEDSDFERDTL